MRGMINWILTDSLTEIGRREADFERHMKLLFLLGFQLTLVRLPKIALPTLIWVAPNSTAIG